MKNSWYNIVRFYIRIGLFFLHKRISVYGKENIPKKGAVLFIGNHQNALIDAILIPTTTNRNIYFLSRASAFKNKLARFFLNSLHMIPIYRIRDGINTIEKNVQVFEQCHEILNNKEAIEIFAEGEHHLSRKIIPLKKGFARIILGTLQKYPDLEIQIVPIGFNYDSLIGFPSSVSIYYGEPILANNFINVENPDLRFSKIIKEVSSAMKKLTLHIEEIENYDEIITKLEKHQIDYTNPIEANKLYKNIDKLTDKSTIKKRKINWFIPIHIVTKLNSLIPIFIWKYLKSLIKDIIFMNTFRFAVIATLFPLFYLLQTVLVYYFFSLKFAVVYLVSCIVLGIISKRTMQVNL